MDIEHDEYNSDNIPNSLQDFKARTMGKKWKNEDIQHITTKAFKTFKSMFLPTLKVPNKYRSKCNGLEYTSVYAVDITISDDDPIMFFSFAVKCSRESSPNPVFLLVTLFYSNSKFSEIDIQKFSESYTEPLENFPEYGRKLLNFNKTYDTFPEFTDLMQDIKEFKTSGGALKYKYKGRAYMIKTGSRGGKYIVVTGKKIYV